MTPRTQRSEEQSTNCRLESGVLCGGGALNTHEAKMKGAVALGLAHQTQQSRG